MRTTAAPWAAVQPGTPVTAVNDLAQDKASDGKEPAPAAEPQGCWDPEKVPFTNSPAVKPGSRRSPGNPAQEPKPGVGPGGGCPAGVEDASEPPEAGLASAPSGAASASWDEGA